MNRDMSDLKERLTALETSRSFHVEAPAGSGKTYLLTARYLKLLGEVSHPLEILALTFTNKAAGEMRSRVVESLLRAESGDSSGGSPDDRLTELARLALRKQDRHRPVLFSRDGLNIMTFHSFCFYLAKRAPLESQLPPEGEILDESAQRLLIAEALSRLRRRVFALPRTDLSRQAFENRLIHHNNNWTGFAEELRGVVLRKDLFGDLIDEVARVGLRDLPAILGTRLGHYMEYLLTRLRESFFQTPLGSQWGPFIEDMLRQGAEAGSLLPRSLPGTAWESLPQWQDLASRLLTQEGRPRKRLGPREGFYKNFSDSPWFELITNLPLEVADALRETRKYPLADEPLTDIDALKDFMILSSEMLREYEALCRARQAVDFIGLERAALGALNIDTPTDLQLYLDYRIRHLLVDEFQDTSLNQWELIKRLVSGWEPGDGRTAFLVGDPKQSIYGFRNAEVRLFLQAREGIPLSGAGTLPLETLSLAANFRSAPLLIDWVNNLFGRTVMASPREGADEISFSPSSPSGMARPGPASLSLHLFSHPDPEMSKVEEAKWLASKIGDLLARERDGSDIAVLLFNRNRLRFYLRALKEAGLPVQVQEGLSLSERPEVRYLLEFARLIARPQDDLAWASLLRSPWFWCDLNTLYETSRQQGGGWREKLIAMASCHPQLRDLTQALDFALKRTGREPLGQVVKNFWERLDGPRLTAALYGMAGVANCLRFFDMLRQVEEGIPQITLSRLESILDSAYEPPDPSMSRSSIQMMTVHRAKGLEFDVVFLPYLDWKPLASGSRTLPPYLLERLPGPAGESLPAMGPDRRVGEEGALFRILQSLKRNRSWGEAKRLFYVAATRAKTSLLMSGIMSGADQTFSPGDRSVLKWVLDHEGLSGKPFSILKDRPSSSLEVWINPDDEKTFGGRPPEPILSEPLPFSPEPIPYTVEYPAALEPADGSGLPGAPGNLSLSGGAAAVVGTVTHRILSRLIRGGQRPSEKAVSLALEAEGLAPHLARAAAGEALAEAAAAISDPFIKRLCSPDHPLCRSEWGLEGQRSARTLRVGVLDLVTFDGTAWWIVDFKTSRPAANEATADFIDRQERLYRSQLTAYRSMLESLTRKQAGKIHAGIYFTFLRLWHEVA